MPKEMPRWFRQRGYAHFDRPLGPDSAIALACDPERVATHSFWPLLQFTKKVPRFERDPETKKRHRVAPKTRELCYAAHADSHIFAKYAADIDSELEKQYVRGFGSSVLAYRRLSPPQSNVDFAVAAFNEIAQRANCDVVALDLKDFFGSIDHAALKIRWRALFGASTSLPTDHFAIYRAITRFSWMERSRVRELLKRDVPRRRGRGGERVCSPEEFRGVLRPHIRRNETGTGIPQGSPISAVLANMFMLEVDEILHRALGELDASYRRYSDDILVIGPPGCASEAEREVVSAVARVKLIIQDRKTNRVAFRTSGGVQEGFAIGPGCPAQRVAPLTLQYLGLAWDGKAIRLKQATVAGFIAKMVHGVRSAESAARRNQKTKVFRRKLYRKFSQLGRSARVFGPRNPEAARHRNFIHYGLGAAEAAGGEALRKQVGRLWVRLNREIQDAEERLQHHV